jgi:hypothetical protein
VKPRIGQPSVNVSFVEPPRNYMRIGIKLGNIGLDVEQPRAVKDVDVGYVERSKSSRPEPNPWYSAAR